MNTQIPIKTEIASKRLAKTLDHVWWRLPEDAHRVIAARLYLVSDSAKYRTINNEWLDRDACGYLAPGKGYIIYLNPQRLGKYDSRNLQLILAHELAHLYLGHIPLPVLNANVTEPQADRCTLAWGFGADYAERGVTTSEAIRAALKRDRRIVEK